MSRPKEFTSAFLQTETDFRDCIKNLNGGYSVVENKHLSSIANPRKLLIQEPTKTTPFEMFVNKGELKLQFCNLLESHLKRNDTFFFERTSIYEVAICENLLFIQHKYLQINVGAAKMRNLNMDISFSYINQSAAECRNLELKFS